MALTNDLISKGIFNNSFGPMDVVCFTQSPYVVVYIVVYAVWLS